MQLKIKIKTTLFCLAGIILAVGATEQTSKQIKFSPLKSVSQQIVFAADSTVIDSSPIPKTFSTKETIIAQVVDFSNDTVGTMPTSFVPAVGNWTIDTDNDNQVLVVDGSEWKEGQAADGVVEEAKTLYGEGYAEFLDSIQAYAYFPFAVAKTPENFTQGDIAFHFKSIDGSIDQAAGIVFNLKPNGDYLVIRANPLENNLILFKYEGGERSSVKEVSNTPTPSRTWHELKLNVTGDQIQGYLNGELYLQHQLPAPVSGKIGVWSKADSVVYFDDFTVTPKN